MLQGYDVVMLNIGVLVRKISLLWPVSTISLIMTKFSTDILNAKVFTNTKASVHFTDGSRSLEDLRGIS